MTSLKKTLLGLSFVVPYVFAQDHTQCADSGSDWYTSVVGETPCRTYEQLRKLCNSEYVLGTLNPITPPDTCDDQIADCCCNSIAFGLSMLCLTCQQGIGDGNGIDAGVLAYQQYLQHGTNFFCTPNTNLSFTTDIQAAVCNNNLKIHNNFYKTFWPDGQWFYTYYREQMETTNAADGNNSFTHCASTTLNVTSSSQSQSILRSESTLLSQSTSVPKSTSFSLSSMISLTESSAASATSASTLPHSTKSLTAGAIAGIAVGSLAFVGAITLFLLWLYSYRRRQIDLENSETSPTPFTISNSTVIFLAFLLLVLTKWVYSPIYVKQCWDSHAHEQSRVGSRETAQDERTEAAAT
ncbi:hypothetical protein ARMSODRAFT_554039 [Armillaria solidipes]|uniref:Uncharacterized protein n=1 Tax=Armillaria solidipes TaxID=1076256 RepID=A0A2H3BJ73_9AGAR|nr:hypothetical protein ARMSODRAFT_554039 [Armillaria solidipes]